MKTKLKISNTSKMPCPSWSLEALTTCAGARHKDGTIVDACEVCYARKGFYRMKNTKNARQYNKQDWKRNTWVPEMVEYINLFEWFRWFDSGWWGVIRKIQITLCLDDKVCLIKHNRNYQNSKN